MKYYYFCQKYDNYFNITDTKNDNKIFFAPFFFVGKLTYSGNNTSSALKIIF